MVIVQLEPATGGTNVPPAFTAVPTAQVPPSAKVPVPFSRVRVMAVGIHGPASRFVFGLAVLVMVKLAVLHPVVTFVHEIEKEAALNESGTLPELMTWMS